MTSMIRMGLFDINVNGSCYVVSRNVESKIRLEQVQLNCIKCRF